MKLAIEIVLGIYLGLNIAASIALLVVICFGEKPMPEQTPGWRSTWYLFWMPMLKPLRVIRDPMRVVRKSIEMDEKKSPGCRG